MIRVAILGAGIGREHLLAYRRLPEKYQVLTVVDQNTARAEELRQNDTFAVAEDVMAALNDPDIDLVDICLPPHLHVPVCLNALEAGKHVICEKPLATSLEGAHLIAQAAKTSGKKVFPVFQYRWGPAFNQLRRLIAEDLAGKPQVASVETHWSRGADYYAVPWRGTWAGEQGGAVLGHAIHNHDLLTHFMGPVSRVAAMMTTRVNDIETEDCATISFEMQNGALASSSITLGAATNESRIRLVFEHLTATSGSEPYAPGTGTWIFTARDPAKQEAVDRIVSTTPVAPVGFEGFLTGVAQALRGVNGAAVTLAEGIASIELVTAMYSADRTATYVNLPLPDTHPMFKGWQP
ncbi:Gfo/Idh/MocA family protein [Roseobacter ponti]|uniref:Gfo/Idh/MocA family oxidoreductase n=1 Tax=Roseobacter ponti TaxID=1891787 RepID=A0A858SMN4_9RHOB|nr:Gfo/Idh/MocA family oxidoreductase [Roseobacter ponti]QJF49955.1 Gfo/Idh/MocA family oxidoreductase [Roseobacter ponti]